MSTTWWVKPTELIDEQLKVLDLGTDKSLLIAGPPGSGKTNLLLLRANHIHIAEKSEFYIVTFTKLLSQFIATGAKQYSFPKEKIITQNKLFRSVLADHGIHTDIPDDAPFQEVRDTLNEKLKKLIGAKKGRNSFPAIFVDEAQDYDAFEIEAFKYLAKVVCFTADIRQGLYQSASSLEALSAHCDETILLNHHFRTGKKILACTDRLMNGKLDHVPMLDTSMYREDKLPSSIEIYGKLSLDAQVSAVTDRLLQQLKAYPDEILGVLVPRREEFKLVWERMSSNPAISEKITNALSKDFDPERPIWVSTIHSSKGVEFRTVHLVSAERIAKFTRHSRRLAFTAMTRAKTALNIYHDEPLPVFMDAAVAEPVSGKISVGQLFGKK